MELHDMNLENQRLRWNQAMGEVLKHFAPETDINDVDLAVEGPKLLEQTTFAKQPQESHDQFVVVTGPSGVGKGTIGAKLEADGIAKLRRVNTRAPRPGEDESAYEFVSDEEYDSMLANGAILCPTDSGDNRAGINKAEFLRAIESGSKFYIDAGAGTARQIKKETGVADFSFSVVFILPPNLDEMVRRINKRRTEEATLVAQGIDSGEIMDDAIVTKRVETAIRHLSESPATTDYFVVSDDVERSTKQIEKLLTK